MILNEQEVTERMESPINLINRLRSMGSKDKISIPSIPTSSDVIKDIDEKIAFGGLKSKASTIMMKALNELDLKVSDTTKVSDLTKIAAEMNRIVTAENENKTDENKPQIVFYAPQFNQENNYETIYARE